ncbi:MAG: MmgE/PrpD family protein [Thermodesulfobacteriota bacterium]
MISREDRTTVSEKDAADSKGKGDTLRPATRSRLTEIIGRIRENPVLTTAQLEIPDITQALAAYLASSQSAILPEEPFELAKRHILDTFVSIVVSAGLKPARLAREFALYHGGKADSAHLLTTTQTTTLLDAVMSNAITAHAAEINDFCPSAFVQPGPPIVSSVFGIGETTGASGEEMIRAVIAGYEIACRLPKALGINNLQTAGLSSHGIGPTFGSAAAAASLLRIPKDHIGFVLAYCVQQASGSYNWIRDTEHIEKAFLFAGMPARNGVSAALMVHHGFSGVKDPFHGTPNWLLSSIFLGPESDLDLNKLIHHLGKEFQMPLVGYKRYPVGGPTQPGIEGLLQLIKKVDRHSIINIQIKMPGNITVFSEAKMPALNLPYLSAVILEDGDLTFEMAQSEERMTSPSIKKKMERVALGHDPGQERTPRVESAMVEARLKNGKQERIFIEHVLGFPDRPMNRQDVEDKARSLATPVLGKERTDKLIETCWNLEKLPDIRTIIPLLIPRG